MARADRGLTLVVMSDHRLRKQAMEEYRRQVADLSQADRQERSRKLRELATPEQDSRGAPDTGDHRDSLRRLRIALDDA